MPAPFVLHAAQGAVGSTGAPDLAFALLCLAAGSSAGSALALLGRCLASRRAAAVIMSLLAATAVAVAVVPFDHLAGTAHAHEAVHASHCHDTPGSCADAPIASGPGQLLSTEPLLPAPALAAVLLIALIPALRGVTWPPLVRPPMQMLRAELIAN